MYFTMFVEADTNGHVLLSFC